MPKYSNTRRDKNWSTLNEDLCVRSLLLLRHTAMHCRLIDFVHHFRAGATAALHIC